MTDHLSIIKNIAKGNLKQVYFLHGEEPFFIDLIEKFITSNVVDESARDFDQTIFYGKDTDLQTVVNAAKRFPMMGDKQVIAVREAQNIKSFDLLAKYLLHPQDQTVLVFAFKGKKASATILKKLKGDVEVFESKRIYESKVPSWIIQRAESEHLQISEKSAVILCEYLGNDLAKIDNELRKLAISLPKGSMITPEIIEQNIGISKDYNVFELCTALANRNVEKSNQIAKHFANNEKNHPLAAVIPQLYKLFSKIMSCHFAPSPNPEVLSNIIGVNKYFLKDYTTGQRNYNKRKLFNIISLLNEYDLKSKGYGNSSTSDGELLKELVFKILH